MGDQRPAGRRWRARWVACAAAACLVGTAAGLAALSASSPSRHTEVSAGQTRAVAAAATVVNVLSYGAVPDGATDNTAAFARAISAAQAATTASGVTATLLIPSGDYAFTQLLSDDTPSVRVLGTVPVNITGPTTGNPAVLVQHVSGQPLMQIQASTSTVEHLSLDCRSFTGGVAITVLADNTTVAHDAIYGAAKNVTIGSGAGAPYALSYPGKPGATQNGNPTAFDNTGNVVTDDAIWDGVNNDGFSFSYQENATISNITHYGSRLALFVDANVTVTNYTYTPNPECLGSENGFYVTMPSSNITITDFITNGQGGIIGGSADTHTGTNITIDHEQFLNPAGGDKLQVGNVQGLTVNNTNFDPSPQAQNALSFTVNQSTTASITNSELSRINVGEYLGAGYKGLTLTFGDASTSPPYSDTDTFDAVTAGGASFVNYAMTPAGPASITINGGTFANSKGGLDSGFGSNATFTVHGLSGYTG